MDKVIKIKKIEVISKKDESTCVITIDRIHNPKKINNAEMVIAKKGNKYFFEITPEGEKISINRELLSEEYEIKTIDDYENIIFLEESEKRGNIHYMVNNKDYV